MNFEEEAPSNLGTGVAETNPLATIFSEDYSFGARIYNIENNPGSAPPLPGIPIETPTEFPPAAQEPTPAALVPGNPGANMAWFVWTGVSPIQVSIPSGGNVQSLYISGNSSGQVIYITSGYTAGGFMTVSPGYTKDLIPIPPGSPLLTLYVASFSADGFASPVYVCAYGDVWNPFDDGGSGNGTLIWLNDDQLGSGEVYTNTSPNIQLVSVGGTSALAYINGVQVSGGQPGTYTLNPGDTIVFYYGYDETVLSLNNALHYYPMEALGPGYTATDFIPGNSPVSWSSLEEGPPPSYAAPVVDSTYTITADNSPCVEVNAAGANPDNYGWIFAPGGVLSGAWSLIFWFQDRGQYEKSLNNAQNWVFLLRSTTANPEPCISCAYTPVSNTNPESPIQAWNLGNRNAVGATLPVPTAFTSPGTSPSYPRTTYPPHMIVITWDGNQTMNVGFDDNTPTPYVFSTMTSDAQFLPPSLMGDNNGQYCTHFAIAKVAIFSGVVSSAEILELYEQGLNPTLPVFQFYQVSGTS